MEFFGNVNFDSYMDDQIAFCSQFILHASLSVFTEWVYTPSMTESKLSSVLHSHIADTESDKF